MEESIRHQRPNAQNNTNNSDTNSMRVVQVNWLKFMYHSWKRISILNRFVVLFSVTLVILQLATAIFILITSSNDSCDQPLRTFIIVYVIRITLSCPFHVVEHFRRAERRRIIQRRQAQERRREDQLRMERQRRRQERQQRRQSSQPIAEPMAPSNASIASVASTIVQPRSNWIFAWGEKLKILVDLFAVLWFIVGNYLLFITTTCRQEAPRLYYTTLTFVLLGYMVAILPLLLYMSVVMCLPCVMRVLRDLNITDIEDVNKDDRKGEISKIPVFRYKSLSSGSQESNAAPTKEITGKQRGFLPRLFKNYRNHEIEDLEDSGAYEEMTIASEEDALCCICLSDYEDKDLICKLWCGHHFHRSCVTDWLQLNRKCPLCKQDFRGKGYDEDSSSENEEESGQSSRNGNEFRMAQMNSNR